MTSAASSHLRRVWKSAPLSRLKQGSTLTIHSKIKKPILVHIQPAWRDDGLAEFYHIRDKDEWPMTMEVKQVEDEENTLGRMEPHTLIELMPAVVSSATKSGSEDVEGLVGVAVDETTPKPVEKVMKDDGSVSKLSGEELDVPDGHTRTDYHDGVAHIHKMSSDEKPAIQLTVHIPEKSSLKCYLLEGGGNITIESKIEGDVSCHTSDGNIVVDKLRGTNILLLAENTNNLIFASSILEGQNVRVESHGRIRAKQIHGSHIQVTVAQDVDEEENLSSCSETEDVDDEKSLVDISSLFVSKTGGAAIDVNGNSSSLDRRAVRVKSHHGPVKVTAYGFCRPKLENPLTNKKYPLVELGGVNGSCEVCIDFSNAECSDDDDDFDNSDDEDNNDEKGVQGRPDDSDWSSCMVHVDSLAQDTVSLVTADQGRINLTFDRKVEADLRLASVPDVDNVVTAGSIIADGDNSESVVKELRRSLEETGLVEGAKQISIQTEAFTPREGASFTAGCCDYVEGWIENKSAEPDSRFEQKQFGDASVGKIRLEAASKQALYGFTSATKKRGVQARSDYLRPLFAAVGTNVISVETVSWLGAIARRYGLDETRTEAGRTASRKGRDLKPRD